MNIQLKDIHLKEVCPHFSQSWFELVIGKNRMTEEEAEELKQLIVKRMKK